MTLARVDFVGDHQHVLVILDRYRVKRFEKVREHHPMRRMRVGVADPLSTTIHPSNYHLRTRRRDQLERTPIDSNSRANADSDPTTLPVKDLFAMELCARRHRSGAALPELGEQRIKTLLDRPRLLTI